jgi:membrane-bound serine protease (ClpP class)
MKRTIFSLILILAPFILSLSLSFSAHLDEEKKVVISKEYALRKVLSIKVDNIINPVSAEFIGKSIKRVNDEQAEALIIELDTPGGLDTSMRSIIKDIRGSKRPVIVYVSPSGARAASAGVFITMASHLAAMAPGTNIGAAHPVGATNDAVAYIKSIAEETGRNAEWAEEAVRKSVSVTEKEALKKNIIDIISNDVKTLLEDIDGKEVTTSTGKVKLQTAHATLFSEEMGIRYQVLNFISNPSVAYMLMLLGFYGLFFELTNPGAIFPGVTGAIFLVLAFYSFQQLPVNYAGILLIILGLVMFMLEVKVVSYGMLTVGGIISMTIGSLMLFESPAPFLKVSLQVIVPAVVVTAMFFTITFRLAYKAFRSKPVTGKEGLVGMTGRATADITHEGGMVSVHGELWSAYSDEPIKKEDDIIVLSVSGLKLKVKKKEGE